MKLRMIWSRPARAQGLFPADYLPGSVGRGPRSAGALFASYGDLSSGSAWGIPVAEEEGGIWLLPTDQHTGVSGRTGSGKTYGCAMSAIVLEARRKGEKGNLFVVDAKSGIFEKTHDLVSSAGYEVRLLDLRTGCGDRVNVLGEAFAKGMDKLESTAHDVFDRLTDAIEDKGDRYWKQAVILLASAATMNLAALGITPSIPRVAKLVADSEGLKALGAQSRETPYARLLAAAMAPMGARETWSCVQGCASASLAYFTSGAGKKAASESDFSLTEALCRTGRERPIAFYLISPDESSVGADFASLLLDRAYATVVEESERGRSPRELQIFIDEAPRFPRTCLPDILSTGRSRGVWAHLYYQQVRQFWERAELYTQDEVAVMMGQMNTLVHLSSSDADEAARLETTTGCREILPTLSQLPVGHALIESRGHPIVRTRIPSFDDLDERGAFGR